MHFFCGVFFVSKYCGLVGWLKKVRPSSLPLEYKSPSTLSPRGCKGTSRERKGKMETCVHQPKRGKKAVGNAKQRALHEVRRFRHLSLAQDCPLTSSALTLCWTASDCGQKISPGHYPAPASRPVLIVSPPLHPPIYVSIYLPIHPPIYLCMYLSIHLPIYLCIYVSIYVSM